MRNKIIEKTLPSIYLTNIAISGTLGRTVILERVSEKSKLLRGLCLTPFLCGKLVQDPQTGKWISAHQAREKGFPVRGPTYLVFASGKYICAGIKDLGMVHDTLKEIQKDLKRCGYNTKPTWKVQNVNFTGHIPCEINLSIFVGGKVRDIDYDPEVYPGAIYRLPGKKAITVTFYHSGRFIVAGIQRQNVDDAHKEARKVVKTFIESIPTKAFIVK